VTLDIVGSPSSSHKVTVTPQLWFDFAPQVEKGWLKFQPAMGRDEIPKFLSGFDVMVHAFRGSLDKSILEATMRGLPVVTVNAEYQHEFGTWAGTEFNDDLESELISFLNLETSRISQILQLRFQKALNNHSLSTWLVSLNSILKGI
jgi:hypothetical protein